MSSFEFGSNPQAGSNPQSGPSSPTGSETPTGDWETHYDADTDANWYYNKKTGLSTWVKPGTDGEWVEFYDDKAGAKYYYNTLTAEAVWENPNTDTEEIEFKLDEAKPISPVEKLEVTQVALETYKRYFSKISDELRACRNDCNGKYCDKNAESVPPVPSVSPGKNANSIPPVPAVSPGKKDGSTLKNGTFFPGQFNRIFSLSAADGDTAKKSSKKPSKSFFRKSGRVSPIGGARTRKKRRAFIKRTKSRRKFTKRTKSRRKLSKRTKNKK